MKTLYTTIDPIPSHIPRQLAIELLQSHGELITLNPLVLEYRTIKAPRDAPTDEFYSTWYEIQQRIQFVPGIGKMGSSRISFRGCFHDMPWGVQTHMYVPFGVDLRHKYQIRGNQPGEAPEPKELGSNAPPEGLYLRTDTQIKCNMTMLSFVKKEQKAASKTMIDRMIKKAELIDAGVLQAMFDDTGRLRTTNPNDRSQIAVNSPAPATPSVYGPQGINLRSSGSHRDSAYSRQSSYQPPKHNSFAVEMEGDSQYGSHPHLSPPSNSRFSTYSELGANSPGGQSNRWSALHTDDRSSRDGSVYSGPTAISAPEGVRSPRPETKSFAAELPNNETVPPRPPKTPAEGQENQQPQQSYQYNPLDYGGVRPLR